MLKALKRVADQMIDGYWSGWHAAEYAMNRPGIECVLRGLGIDPDGVDGAPLMAVHAIRKHFTREEPAKLRDDELRWAGRLLDGLGITAPPKDDLLERGIVEVVQEAWTKSRAYGIQHGRESACEAIAETLGIGDYSGPYELADAIQKRIFDVRAEERKALLDGMFGEVPPDVQQRTLDYWAVVIGDRIGVQTDGIDGLGKALAAACAEAATPKKQAIHAFCDALGIDPEPLQDESLYYVADVIRSHFEARIADAREEGAQDVYDALFPADTVRPCGLNGVVDAFEQRIADARAELPEGWEATNMWGAPDADGSLNGGRIFAAGRATAARFATTEAFGCNGTVRRVYLGPPEPAEPEPVPEAEAQSKPKCDRCRGTGKILVSHTAIGYAPRDCPDCEGTGIAPEPPE